MFKPVCAVPLLLVVFSGLAEAQENKSPLLPQSTAARHGLQRSWYTQIQLDRTQNKIAHLALVGDTLLVQTYTGLLQALDAETGRTLWSEQIGSPRFPTLEPAANEKYVAAINGSQLYVLHRENGKLAFHVECSEAPGAGPALTATRVYVPMVSGRIESYLLEDSKQPPWVYYSFGRALLQPLSTPRSLCWTTDQGHLYVSRPEDPEIRFRIETDDAIVTRPAYSQPYLITVSNDGFVYCVHENSGRQKWRFSTGDPISHPPIVIDGKLYVFPDRVGAFCLEIETGKELWQSPRVAKFLAASKDRLYCADSVGRIVILDAATGGRVGGIDTTGLTLLHPNIVTDRIYVGMDYGLVQCLHEVGLETPLQHNVLVASETEEGKEGEDAEADGSTDKPKPEEKQPRSEDEDEEPADESEEGAAEPFDGPADGFDDFEDPADGASPFD